jgi:hypothetical protein
MTPNGKIQKSRRLLVETQNLSQTVGHLTLALAPAFAAGFAVQQALQIVNPLVRKEGDAKRAIMGLISLALGLLVAVFGDLHILNVLAKVVENTASVSRPLDIGVSALIVSAGTEGFNSIMKFLSYQKEAAKSTAAIKTAAAAATIKPTTKGALDLVNG